MASPSNAAASAPADGLHLVLKKDCPTCVTIEAAIIDLVGRDVDLAVYSQDDPAFPASVTAIDDTDLSFSWHNNIETVPTLIRVEAGAETERIVGWERSQWEAFTGQTELAPEIAGYLPGCGSKSVDPDLVDELAWRFGKSSLRSKRVEFAAAEDEVEAMYERGWSDGLPIVAPTEERVARMLAGTTRDPQDVVAVVPPLLKEATVEQVAINAVMAGCRPEYLPVVLTAVEAACTDQFNMHGLLCTLWFSGPVIVVNGPIRDEIGMNYRKNVLSLGSRSTVKGWLLLRRRRSRVARRMVVAGGRAWLRCRRVDRDTVRRSRSERRDRSDLAHSRGSHPITRRTTDRHRSSAPTIRSHARDDTGPPAHLRRGRMEQTRLP